MSKVNGIHITSQDQIFSAHNLKIIINHNTLKKNQNCGIQI